MGHEQPFLFALYRALGAMSRLAVPELCGWDELASLWWVCYSAGDSLVTLSMAPLCAVRRKSHVVCGGVAHTAGRRVRSAQPADSARRARCLSTSNCPPRRRMSGAREPSYSLVRHAWSTGHRVAHLLTSGGPTLQLRASASDSHVVLCDSFSTRRHITPCSKLKLELFFKQSKESTHAVVRVG